MFALGKMSRNLAAVLTAAMAAELNMEVPAKIILDKGAATEQEITAANYKNLLTVVSDLALQMVNLTQRVDRMAADLQKTMATVSLLSDSGAVTDGLVVYLDSTNPDSYPGSGTTWFDLSGKGNHGTLERFSGPGSGTTSGFNTGTTYMMFDRHLGPGDGVNNNVVTFKTGPILTDKSSFCGQGQACTIELWLKMTTYTCTAITKQHGAWELYYCPHLVFRTESPTGVIDSSAAPLTYELNKFVNIIATSDGLTKKLYVNGQLQSITYMNGITPASYETFTSLGLGAYSSGFYSFQGALPVYKIYSRALLSGEVTRNFQALRGFFGI